MTTTLEPGRAARPKQTSVPRIQPSLDGGRPTDPLTLAFEGIMEGIVACGDDRRAFERATERLRQVRTLEARLIQQLEARASRLFEKIEPELHRVAAETDRALTERTVAAR
jgi:hypothetical protein